MLIERVMDLARKRLAMIGDGAPVVRAAGLLGNEHTNLVVVCDPVGKMVGVMNKTDIMKHISHCRGHACTISVSSIMSRDVISCQTKDRLPDIWTLMKAQGIHCVPVVDADSKPLGILYAHDVLDVLLTEAQDEEELLRDYVMSIGYHWASNGWRF